MTDQGNEGIPGDTNLLVQSHSQTLSHRVVHQVHSMLCEGMELAILTVVNTDGQLVAYRCM